MLHKHTNNIYQLHHIETERLFIRPLQQGDEFGLHASILRSIEALSRWMPWAHDTRFQVTHDFIHRNAQCWQSQTAKDYPLIVIHKASDTIISASGYNEHTDLMRPYFEIGYWMDSAYVGKGLASELVNALTRYALEAIQAIRVQICTQVGNEKSSNLAKRCGYTYEAVLRNICLDCQTHLPCDGLLFSCNQSKKLPPLSVKWKHDFSIKIKNKNIISSNLPEEILENAEKLPVLQTKNICLRAPKIQDTEKLQITLMACLDTLSPQFLWAKSTMVAEDIQHHLQQGVYAANNILAAEDLFFLVWDRYFKKVFGEVFCKIVDWAVPHVSINAWFDEKEVDQEIACEALFSFIRFIFAKRNAKCITFYISEKNVFMLNVANKLGFHYEGTLNNYFRNFLKNEISAAKLFSMTSFSQLATYIKNN